MESIKVLTILYKLCCTLYFLHLHPFSFCRFAIRFGARFVDTISKLCIKTEFSILLINICNILFSLCGQWTSILAFRFLVVVFFLILHLISARMFGHLFGIHSIFYRINSDSLAANTMFSLDIHIV